MRWLCILLALAPMTVFAQQEIEPDDIRLELILEERAHSPYVGEMVLLMIRGTYKVAVVREKLAQSPMPGIDWMQLGEDRWYKAREDGFEVLKFERRMALFPQEAGRIAIPRFKHELEVLNPRGQTIATTEISNDLTLEAQPLPEVEGWWFPVRGLEISDRWSNQPEALNAGAAALRIVALTVEGTAPQRIPPMPELTGAGAFIFPHPEQKIVALGPDGPMTRVFWRWTVRPQEGTAGYTNPVPITYFDAEARELKTITLSAQRVAYAEGAQQVMAKDTDQTSVGSVPESGNGVEIPRWAVPLAFGGGLALGLVWILRQLRGSGLSWSVLSTRNHAGSGLRKAVRANDPPGVWRHARALLRGRPGPESLGKLDKALFGNGPMPDLREVARAVRASRRS